MVNHDGIHISCDSIFNKSQYCIYFPEFTPKILRRNWVSACCEFHYLAQNFCRVQTCLVFHSLIYDFYFFLIKKYIFLLWISHQMKSAMKSTGFICAENRFNASKSVSFFYNFSIFRTENSFETYFSNFLCAFSEK